LRALAGSRSFAHPEVRLVQGEAEIKLPTEQDVLRAIAHWQANAALCRGEETCSPGTCMCCSSVSELLRNTPLVELVRNVAQQIEEGTASPMDALLSLYVFGLLTEQMVEARIDNIEVSEKSNRRAI